MPKGLRYVCQNRHRIHHNSANIYFYSRSRLEPCQQICYCGNRWNFDRLYAYFGIYIRHLVFLKSFMICFNNYLVPVLLLLLSKFHNYKQIRREIKELSYQCLIGYQWSFKGIIILSASCISLWYLLPLKWINQAKQTYQNN